MKRRIQGATFSRIQWTAGVCHLADYILERSASAAAVCGWRGHRSVEEEASIQAVFFADRALPHRAVYLRANHTFHRRQRHAPPTNGLTRVCFGRQRGAICLLLRAQMAGNSAALGRRRCFFPTDSGLEKSHHGTSRYL